MSHITRLWLFLLPIVAAVSGCRSVKDVQVHTEYRTLYHRDSVFVDCTDTIYVIERGDTVRVKEKQTVREYHWTVFVDTVRLADTVTVEKVTTLAPNSEGKKVNRWAWFFSGAGVAIFCIFAARIIIKIYLKR